VQQHTPPLAKAMAMIAAASMTHEGGFHINPKNFRTLLSCKNNKSSAEKLKLQLGTSFQLKAGAEQLYSKFSKKFINQKLIISYQLSFISFHLIFLSTSIPFSSYYLPYM